MQGTPIALFVKHKIGKIVTSQSLCMYVTLTNSDEKEISLLEENLAREFEIDDICWLEYFLEFLSFKNT